MKRKILLLLIPLALANLFCTFGAPAPTPAAPTPDLAAMVDATLTAVASNSTPAPTDVSPGGALVTASSTPGARDYFPEMGTVQGELMFPASGIPALRIVFFNPDGSVAAYTDTTAGQNTYSMDMPVGTYTVVAYSVEGGVAGGYTQAVPCGLQYGCDDHTLIPITVKAGETLTGINPNDYYAPPGTFPNMPK